MEDPTKVESHRIGGIVMDADSMKLIERGKASYVALKTSKNWLWWVDIGYAIDAGRSQILIALGNPNNPQDKKLRDAMGLWLKETGFDAIDKTIRARLKSCMENIDRIEAWREGLSEDDRISWNHPTTVWNHYKKTLEDVVKGPRNPTPNERIMALQEELDEAQERIAELELGAVEGEDLNDKLAQAVAERDDWRKRAEKAEWDLTELKTAAGKMQAASEKMIAAHGRMKKKGV